jgi:hypothetical protein
MTSRTADGWQCPEVSDDFMAWLDKARTRQSFLASGDGPCAESPTKTSNSTAYRLRKASTCRFRSVAPTGPRRIFPDPHGFDISRTPSFTHLTLAAGRKHCLGAHIARMELNEALMLMARTWPKLARAGEVRWHDALAFQGPASLTIATH